MTSTSSIGNTQATSDAVAASLFQQWLFTQSNVTDEKGDKRPGGIQGAAAKAGGGTPPSSSLEQAIGPMAQTAADAAQAAGVPLALVGAALTQHMDASNVLDVAQSPDQKTGPMQISQNRWNALIPQLSDADRKAIENLTGKKPEALNMNDPKQNVVAGAFELKVLNEKNQGDQDKILRDYVQNVLGLDPNSKEGGAALSALAAYMLAINELERNQAATPRPRVPTGGAAAEPTDNASSKNAGGAEGVGGNGSGGKGGGSSGGAEGADNNQSSQAGNNNTSDASAQYDNSNFKPVGGKLDLKNPQLARWNDEIMAAAKLSGMPPQVIAGQVWHESRGNPNEKSTNIDGTPDVGLMQISNSRWKNDVLPTLSADDKAQIKAVTGVDAENLDMNNPLHNVIGGAFELKSWRKEAGGDLKRALNGYVSGNLDGHGPGDDNYANNVLRYAGLIDAGKPLPDNE